VSQTLVKEALKGASLAALGDIPTAFANLPFTKPANAKWAAWWFLPNQPSVETLGEDGEDASDGIVQIDINYPLGTGDAEADEDFEGIRSVFFAGAAFSAIGQTVTIINCGCNYRRPADGMFRVSTTIIWKASIPR
jgi:hypothetical protein